MKKAAILAAGEGSRLKSVTPFKPLTLINQTPLLELTLTHLHLHQFASIHIIFNNEEKAMDLSLLPSLNKEHVHYFFQSTPSSMHSLYEITQKMKLSAEEHFLVSMVDSIVRPQDARLFLEFCHGLAPNESALLVTKFIDDEKPLTLKADSTGHITTFQCPLDDETFATSGVYCFSSSVLSLLDEMMATSQSKMRNFLSALVEKNYPLKIFEVEKTLDIDRPEDILQARDFLKEIHHAHN